MSSCCVPGTYCMLHSGATDPAAQACVGTRGPRGATQRGLISHVSQGGGTAARRRGVFQGDWGREVTAVQRTVREEPLG